MCVIFVASKERPTPEMVEQAYDYNDAGAGIAWREGGLVKWEKGLELARVKELVAAAPLPFVVHFRIPTVGGKREELCHPFPVDKDVPLTLKGAIKGFVLFHNGHWKDWKETVLRSIVSKGATLPGGKWSDSRAMAWMAAQFGVSVLEMIDEKSVAFGPKQCEIAGTGWTMSGGVWCSNELWKTKRYRNTTTVVSNEDWSETWVGHNFHGPQQTVRTLCANKTCANVKLAYSDYCYACEEKERTARIAKIREEREKREAAEKAAASVIDVKPEDVKVVEGPGGAPAETPFVQAMKRRLLGALTKEEWKKVKLQYPSEWGKYQMWWKRIHTSNSKFMDRTSPIVLH